MFRIILFVSFIGFYIISFAGINLDVSTNLYALHACEGILLNKQQKELEAKGCKVLAFIETENFFIVEAENFEALNYPCFYSSVKSIGSHLTFNTPKILVKAIHSDGLIGFNFSKHEFIPNLYYVFSNAKQDQELMADLTQISGRAGVTLVSINQVFTLEATTNDPLFDLQWSINNTGSSAQYNGTSGADMSVDSAWTLSMGDSGIKIAILDSGVDTIHEDLVNNILPGLDGFASDSMDTKGFPTPNFSSDGHGTACAGIAAATADNNLGISGIAPNCKIVPIRIFYYQDYGAGIGIQATTSTSGLLNGSAFAWRVADADIMSTSAGLSPLFIAALGINTQLIDDEINTAFNEARDSKGIAMFFSAGNDDIDDVLWPADLDVTIAVGASTMCDERKNPSDCSPESWGSSYGLTLDIVAPGVRIATTDITGNDGYSNGKYNNAFNGTSAACPNAAAVGAMILSMNPDLHARDVKAILNLTADKVSAYSFDSTFYHGSWNLEVGYGRVNAFEALKLAQTYTPTVGVEGLVVMDFLNVYPNPSSGLVWVENQNEQPLTLLLYGVLGEKIDEFDLEAHEARILELSSGMYMIQVQGYRSIAKILVR